jgi:uncharacterized protein HemY
MAERNLAGIAHQEAEPHGDNAVDSHKDHDIHVVFNKAYPLGQERQQKQAQSKAGQVYNGPRLWSS